MGGPNYVLDSTFRSQGSVGTYDVVRVGPGTTNRGYVSKLAGTNTAGTILPLGVAQTGASVSGKEISIRLLGISLAKMQVTSGSIVEGKMAFPSSGAKIKVITRPVGTVPKAILGQIVGAEGAGSPSSLVRVFVHPTFIC